MISEQIKIAIMTFMMTLTRDENSDNVAIGSWSKPFMDIVSGLGIKNFTFVWTEDYYGQDNGNRTYDGTLGLLQQNKADISPIPLDINFHFLGIVTLGPIVYPMEGRIYSTIKVAPHPSDVLNVFEKFEVGVIIQLLLSCFCFILLLSEVETDPEDLPAGGYLVRSLKFFWHFFCLLILNPLLYPRTIIGKQMVLFLSISFMFFTWFWTNMMGTDMTTYDMSRIMHTLEDVSRLNYVTPLFLHQEKYWQLFREDRDKGLLNEVMKKAILIKSINSEDISDQSSKLNQFDQTIPGLIKSSLAIIGSNHLLPMAIDAYCGLFHDMSPESKFYPGKEIFYPSSMAPMYAKDIPKSRKEQFDKRVSRLLENGLMNQFMDIVSHSMFGDNFGFKKPARGCFTTVDQHMELIGPNTGQAVNMVNMTGAFYLLTVGLMIASIAHLIQCKQVYKQLRRLVQSVRRIRGRLTKRMKRWKIAIWLKRRNRDRKRMRQMGQTNEKNESRKDRRVTQMSEERPDEEAADDSGISPDSEDRKEETVDSSRIGTNSGLAGNALYSNLISYQHSSRTLKIESSARRPAEVPPSSFAWK